MTAEPSPAQRIDGILAALPDDQRASLQVLRERIAAAAPDAEEAISYGVPAFRYHGHPLVGYAGAKAHCSLFPMSPAVVAAHLDELAGFDSAKGTIRFTPAHPIPAALVERIVRDRMAENRRPLMAAPALPTSIGPFVVPQDDVSAATWRWANRSLPRYLLAHSVRSYGWGAAIAEAEGWRFDDRVLWTAALWHDVGLTRIPRNSMCFEVEGAELARRWLERAGLPATEADRVAIAIILHMAPGVTLDDGVESVLLDRATGVDVRGHGYATLTGDARDAVTGAFPRGDFDRWFLRAIEREVAIRPGCESERLLRTNDPAGWLARSPWKTSRPVSAAPSDPRGV